jgi:mannose-6-phosphate isomerase-like protein (cupin superfamily)
MTQNSQTKTHRRVVTGHAGAKSTIKSDEQLSAYGFNAVPGYEHTLIWASNGIPDLSQEPKQEGYPSSVVPGPGGTTLHIVTFPPDSVFQDPSFDQEAAGREYAKRLPGLAEAFEHENPGMHKTPTVDYAVVLEGEVWLEVDDGQAVHLKRGDVVVQNGTRHAWRNKGADRVTMLFVLHGAKS